VHRFCPKIQVATGVPLDLHGAYFCGVDWVRPAAQGLKQLAGPSVEGIGAYIGPGLGLSRRGTGRDHPDPQALAREQQGQRLAHNATSSNADV
jgi:hypothetical protein